MDKDHTVEKSTSPPKIVGAIYQLVNNTGEIHYDLCNIEIGDFVRLIVDDGSSMPLFKGMFKKSSTTVFIHMKDVCLFYWKKKSGDE